MNLRKWLLSLSRSTKSTMLARRSRGKRPAATVSTIESLEERTLLTTWTVDSLDDVVANDLKLTLREAVAAARTNSAEGDAIAGSDNDIIRFADALFADGPRTIELTQNQPLNVDNQLSSDDGLVTIIGPGSTGEGFDREWLLTIDARNTTAAFTIGDTVTISGLGISNSSAAGLKLNNSADLTLEDVSVTNSVGAGIDVTAGGEVEVLNSVLSHNVNAGRGGAVSVGTNGTAIIRDSVLANNQADEGGGISNAGGRVVVLGSFINDNTATGQDKIGNGGGIVAFSDAKTSVYETTIEGNTSPASGGGIRNRESQLTIGDSIIQNNQAFADGGGISFVRDDDAELVIRGTTIANNTAVFGAGIDNRGGSLNIQGSTVSGNVSRASGGGIAGRVGLNETSPAIPETRIENSTISGNRAFDSGGGVWDQVGNLITTNVTVATNRSDADGDGTGIGGGLHLEKIDAALGDVMYNTLIAGNINGHQLPASRENGAGTTTREGNWTQVTGAGFGNAYRFNAAQDGTATAKWTFEGLETGRYRVLITWVGRSDAATNSPYTIHDGSSAIESVPVNQQRQPQPDVLIEGIHFQELATVTVGSGTLDVQLKNIANGTVVMDAVRIERVDDGSPFSDIEAVNQPFDGFRTIWNLIGDPNSAGGLTNDLPDAGLQSFNIVGNTNENGDLVPWNTDRILFTELADNLGGSTAVHALKIDSPAIDAGSPFRFDPNQGDQRGLPYQRANTRSLNEEPPENPEFPDELRFNPVDIGAFELQPRPLFSSTELVVSTLTDESDGDFSRGDLSLREAVEIANQSPDHNAIRFTPSLFSGQLINGQFPGVTTILQFPLRINWDLTISGPGSNLLNISGGDDSRIFEIGPLADADISGLTLLRASGSASEDQQFDVFEFDVTGGALFNAGNAELVDVVFKLNEDTSTGFFVNGVAGGGAINNRGTLSIRDSELAGNSAVELGGAIRNVGGRMHIGPNVLVANNLARQGGGIDSSGTLTLFDSIVRENKSDEGGGVSITGGQAEIRRSEILNNTVELDPGTSGNGGGISSYGELQIFDTTVAGNRIDNPPPGISTTTTGRGGGVFTGGGGSVYIERTTISGNEIEVGHAEGGGLHIATTGSATNVQIINTTVSGNTAFGPLDGFGGGVFVGLTATAIPHLIDTTIAFNTAARALISNAEVKGGGIYAGNRTDLSNVIISNNNRRIVGSNGNSDTVVAGELFINSPGDVHIVGLPGEGPNGVPRPVLVKDGRLNTLPMQSDGRTPANGASGYLKIGDPHLGPLDIKNGGLTATHKLQESLNNEAVDATERVGLVDQRGFPTTIVTAELPGEPDGTADIGAFETNEQVKIEAFESNIFGASQFGSGGAFIVGVGVDDGRTNSTVEKEPGFLGLEFDPDPFRIGPGIGEGLFGDEWGAEVIADVDGRIGIEYGYYVNAGSVDTSYDGLFSYSIDDSDAESGNYTISTSATLTDGQFYTTSPRVSAYADLVFELNTRLSGAACVIWCKDFELPLNIDESTPLFSLNRQLQDTDGRAQFQVRGADGDLTPELTTDSLNGLNPPAFDGEIMFGGGSISDFIGGDQGDDAAGTLQELWSAREDRQQAETELRIGKNSDGSDLSDADRRDRRSTIGSSIDQEKKATNSNKDNGDDKQDPNCVGTTVQACLSEADGDVLGVEVTFLAGGESKGIGASLELGKVSLTVPDVQLADTTFDNDHGKLSATTDDFVFGSEQDHKRRIARAQIDAAALLGVTLGLPLGTYSLSAGPIEVEATTVSYNVGPQFAVTQDVEVEPFFDDDHGVTFQFRGFSGTIEVIINGLSRTVSNNGTVTFLPGETVTVKTTVGQNVEIVPSLKVGNRFSNDIGVEFDVTGLLEVLALKLEAFGEEIFDVGPLYENEHSLLDLLGIGAVDLGSIFDETFKLPATSQTIKDTKDRDGDGNTSEDLVISLNSEVNSVPEDGLTPGSAISLTSGELFTFPTANRPDENTTVYFSLPLVNDDGIVGRDVSFSSGQSTSFVRPPYSGLSVEFNELNDAGADDKIVEFDLDVAGTEISVDVSSWKLKGFENLLDSRAIFGLRFRSGSSASVLASLETTELAEVSLIYNDQSDVGQFLGNRPDRRLTAEAIRELEQQTNTFVIDNDLAFDIDQNGVVSMTTDGVMIARFMQGQSPEEVIEGAIARDSPFYGEDPGKVIYEILYDLLAEGRLDVDGSSETGAFDEIVDGTLILRHLAGIGLSVGSGPALTDGINFPASATRRHPQDIAEFIDGRLGPRVNGEFANETQHRSNRGISGAADALRVAANAVAGSSPYNPLTLPLIDNNADGAGVFGDSISLSSFGNIAVFEDLYLKRADDLSQRDLVRTNAAGTPGRNIDLPASITGLITDPLSSEISALAGRMVLESREQTLGTEAPVFIKLPYTRDGVGGFSFSLPDGVSLQRLEFDAAVGGNAFLDHRTESNESDIDFDLIVGAEALPFDMQSGIELRDGNGNFRTDVREFRLLPRGLANTELLGDANLSEPDLDIIIGLVLAGPTSVPPSLAVEILDDSLSPTTIERDVPPPERDSQIVMVLNNESVTTNESFSVDVEYHVTDAAAGVPPSLLFEIHYDSSRLKFDGIDNLHAGGLVNSFTANSPEEIELVSDGDPRTDRVMVLSWADLLGSWPADATTGTRLATINFQAEPSIGVTDIHLTGSSSAEYQFGGDVFKTINVVAPDAGTLSIDFAEAVITEGDGPNATTATLSRTGSTAEELVVFLSSSDTTEAAVPASVVIPAGQTRSAPFPTGAADDSVVDGSQTVSITANSLGLISGVGTIQVDDNDELIPGGVFVGSTSAAVEGEAHGAGDGNYTIALTAQPTGPVEITATGTDQVVVSSDGITFAATATLTFTDTSNQKFFVRPIDDDELEGTHSTRVTHAITGTINDARYPLSFGISDNIVAIQDDEVAGLTINLATDSVAESQSTTATVTRTGDISSLVVISLSSSDMSEITVPSTITIEAGQTTSPSFTVSAFDDDLVDGTQTATITASTDGLSSGNVTVDVTDNDTATQKYQHVSSDSTSKSVTAGNIIEIPVLYRTLDDGNPAALQTNLISFNLHFDASALTFVESTDYFTEDIVVAPNTARPENDPSIQGDDNDPATDTVLVTAYADDDVAFNNGWPNAPTESGLLLYVARFTVNPDFSGSTNVNFSANATGNVFPEAATFKFESESLVLQAETPGGPGNIDGDDDFDANDSFLIHLIQLSGADIQIDQSKGSSSFSATQIRTAMAQLAVDGDVDRDGDFDANDSFLIHLVKLSGTDTQIDQSKGSSPLSAAQIRDNIEALGSGGSQAAVTGNRESAELASFVVEETDRRDLFENYERKQVVRASSVPSPDLQVDILWADYRSWIDVL